MKPITIAMVTARREPCFQWFLDSLRLQATPAEVKVILVDFLATSRDISGLNRNGFDVVHTAPKPTVWQGPHRLTPTDWWATSSYRNTAACLCKTEWLAFVDDRCVLLPSYFSALRAAVKGGYAVCGRYEKRVDMTVENGSIKHGGSIIGVDPRFKNQAAPIKAPGSWFFGANTASSLEFLLKVNGYDESCDSLGLEDSVFGSMLEKNRFAIKYDPALSLVQERSSASIEPPLCRRTDKGVSPNDKSHGILARTAGKLRATHDFDLRVVRDAVQGTGLFPIPTTPTHDWWDGKALKEFP